MNVKIKLIVVSLTIVWVEIHRVPNDNSNLCRYSTRNINTCRTGSLLLFVFHLVFVSPNFTQYLVYEKHVTYIIPIIIRNSLFSSSSSRRTWYFCPHLNIIVFDRVTKLIIKLRVGYVGNGFSKVLCQTLVYCYTYTHCWCSLIRHTSCCLWCQVHWSPILDRVFLYPLVFQINLCLSTSIYLVLFYPSLSLSTTFFL